MSTYYYHHTDDLGVTVTATVKELDLDGTVNALAELYPEVIYFEVSRGEFIEVGQCIHCQRAVIQVEGRWVDPLATGDDILWRETCEEHDTRMAEHEVQS